MGELTPDQITFLETNRVAFQEEVSLYPFGEFLNPQTLSSWEAINPTPVDINTLQGIVVYGLPGCGKTTISSQLAERWGSGYIASDVVRDTTGGLTLDRKSIYSILYQECNNAIGNGQRIVVDCTGAAGKIYEFYQRFPDFHYLLVLSDSQSIHTNLLRRKARGRTHMHFSPAGIQGFFRTLSVFKVLEELTTQNDFYTTHLLYNKPFSASLNPDMFAFQLRQATAKRMQQIYSGLNWID